MQFVVIIVQDLFKIYMSPLVVGNLFTPNSKFAIMNYSLDNSRQPLKISRDWTAQKIELKGKFPTLTDDDLKYESGKENELIGRIGRKLKLEREEVISEINQIPLRKIYNS